MYHFYNKLHLGDCLVSLNFLSKLSKLNNIKCEFACESNFHNQLKELIKDSNILITNEIKFNSIDLWGSTVLRRVQARRGKPFDIVCEKYPNLLNVNAMTFEIANQICLENSWENPFKCSNETFLDFPVLKEESKIGPFEYLLVNSYPLSGQIKMSNNQIDELFVKLIERLRKNNKTFISTKKIQNHPCTTDYNLSLAEIGKLSKRCINIIGIPTSVFWICMNRYTLDNCQRIVNFSHDQCHFQFDRDIEIVDNLDKINI